MNVARHDLSLSNSPTAKARHEATLWPENDTHRGLIGELEYTSDELAALRQKARNCVHPDWRKRGEAKCKGLIEANYKALLQGEERKEYGIWLALDKVHLGEPTSLGD